MRFASLGSGSAGNCLVVEQANTRLLLDCGFSPNETVKRLQRLGLEPEQITGILVTHERPPKGGVLCNLFHTLQTCGNWHEPLAQRDCEDE